MNKVPITRAGFEKLKRELEHLKGVSIPENVRDIETARGHGDLSENAEYTAAKERQAFLLSRLQELELNLAASDIIEVKGLTNERAVFGTTVTLQDTGTGEECAYRLVGPFESDIAFNRISVTSPIGKALVSHCVGDVVKVKTPGGLRQFEILDIVAGEED